MHRIILAITLALALGGCTSDWLKKFQAGSANFRAVVAEVNADIAAVAPIVAADCADLQKMAMLIAPFIPNSGKAQQYFGAANGAITAYCQNIPTDINSTASAVLAAVRAAQTGYDQVAAGAK